MATDYAALASDMITRAAARGLARAVTLRRLAVTPPDPDKPWRGPVEPREPAPVRPADSPPLITLDVIASFVDPSSARELGLRIETTDWLRRATQIAIIASPEDLSGYSELVDAAGQVWRIVGCSTLAPGETRILHFLGVSR